MADDDITYKALSFLYYKLAFCHLPDWETKFKNLERASIQGDLEFDCHAIHAVILFDKIELGQVDQFTPIGCGLKENTNQIEASSDRIKCLDYYNQVLHVFLCFMRRENEIKGRKTNGQ